MKIQSVQQNTNFTATFKITNALKEYKIGLSESQKDIFEKNMSRFEKENDGKILKFDYVENSNNVAIYEKSKLPYGKEWIVLIQSTKEKAAWCFDELNSIYNIIRQFKTGK